jgi:diguanylate cyclase (GGDEF)-like protein
MGQDKGPSTPQKRVGTISPGPGVEGGFDIMHEHDGADIVTIVRTLSMEDLFVFRRVERDRFVHLGGAGRGEGWAGLIELRLGQCAPAAGAYDNNRPVTVSFDDVTHVFGPYWTRTATFVPVNHDVMVVFGHPSRTVSPPPADVLNRSAEQAARAVDKVSPAKRLADELELLHAVQNVMAVEPTDTASAMRHVVDSATEFLSCEFGMIWLADGGRFVVSERGWSLGDRLDEARAVVRELTAATSSPVCVQNAFESPLPAPFRAEDGVRSFYRLPLGELGMLLLAHTDVAPRGFTTLCQELGRRLAQASEIVLRTAIQRDQLESELARVNTEARIDALTGLGNRLAWDEHLEKRVRESAGRPTGVIFVDVDHLKTVNDRLGHHAGDSLLQTIAGILRDNVRPSDFVARVGGDEFAVLLPDAEAAVCEAVAERLRMAAAAGKGPGDTPVSFAHGIAVSTSGEGLADALREADAAMYRDKQSL